MFLYCPALCIGWLFNISAVWILDHSSVLLEYQIVSVGEQIQCLQKGPILRTLSSWGIDCWNDVHLVLILHERPHFLHFPGLKNVFPCSKKKKASCCSCIFLGNWVINCPTIMNIFTFEMCNPFGILMNNGSSFYCKGLSSPPLTSFTMNHQTKILFLQALQIC